MPERSPRRVAQFDALRLRRLGALVEQNAAHAIARFVQQVENVFPF